MKAVYQHLPALGLWGVFNLNLNGIIQQLGINSVIFATSEDQIDFSECRSTMKKGFPLPFSQIDGKKSVDFTSAL